MSSVIVAMVLVFMAVVLAVFAIKHLSTKLARQYQETFTTSARVNLTEMFLFIEPKRIFMINMATLLLMPILFKVITGSWVFGILISIVLALLPRFAYKFLHQRRRRKFVHQLPDALTMIASSMQSGANLTSAIEFMAEEMASPAKQEFQLFLREQRLGVEFSTALDNMHRRIPEDEFQLVTAGMQISREVGGNLAEVLIRLSDTLRRKIEMEGKINALTAQGKMQGLVMTVLPVFIGIVLYHMEPASMGRIVTDPIGWGLIVVVTLMLICGYFTIRKIITIDV
ncbi:secretion system protein F [Shewanella maritima]|uniref:Secretion system protein F n=1 Tax=Shewanella maritima TaxID=2520507 RepID=A0A411PG38_9GAMM|nr:type II secretion system F family protein [Shewanella maritima]QBF82523.1 secretion system protein F [Shewanella maritima]